MVQLSSGSAYTPDSDASWSCTVKVNLSETAGSPEDGEIICVTMTFYHATFMWPQSVTKLY